MEKLLIIDGNSILNRAFYGISTSNLLRTKDGIYTNAIFGFLSIMLKEINEEKPTHIAVAFDLRAPTFRHTRYEQYKAGRHGMPEELVVQVPIIKDVLRAMNISVFELEGYEADDIIGTISKNMSRSGNSVAILTGDRDSFQLVDNNIYIKLPHTAMGKTKTEKIIPDSIKEKYSLEPLQMIELKALMGDSSDNIPGIPGVGEKTALTLIQKYNSVDGVYEFLENNPDQKDIKGKLLERLIENKDKAYLSRELGEIYLEVPIEYTLDEIKVKEYKYNELYNLLKKLELKTFIQRLDLEKNIDSNLNQNVDIQIEGFDIDSIEKIQIKDINELTHLLDKINSENIFTYYFTDKERYSFDDIEIFSFLVDNSTYVIEKDILTKDNFIKYFKDIFESTEIKKISFDMKKDYIMLNDIGIKFNNMYFDVLIAKYLLDPLKNKYILEDMINEYFNITLDMEEKKETQITFDLGFGDNSNNNNNDNNKSKIDNAYNICIGVFGLYKIFEKELEEYNQFELFNNIEMKLIPVLADMEIEGVKVDKKVLDEIGNEVDERCKLLEKEIYKLAETEFNINSPKQLGEILFEKLKLPVIKKNKSGYSTDVDVLEKLKEHHDIINKILDYRQVSKIKTTYVDGIRPYINNLDEIHSKLNQTVTATGRLSSKDPNLQNIPVRTDYGRNLRKMFVSRKGCKLIDADYSQIELRVLAHIANDEVMLTAFNNDEDIHSTTAMQVFDLTKEELTSKDRSAAKAVNFGIVYGISDYGLSQSIGKTVKQAKEYIEKYLSKYSGIKEFMDKSIEVAKEKGYVETMFNRRRYIPEIKSSNYNIRQFGERVSINTPIQGTAADIIKIAMINVHNELKSKNLKSRLILQIHDELIIESPDNEVDEVKELLSNCMENAVKLNVKLKVDINVGNSWYETK